jgi:diadenosine tetraphosphate (Ap4A) HIT family hydrolase
MAPLGSGVVTNSECALCNVPAVDADFGRVEVWRDSLWRLTTSVGPGDPTSGFSYLEPLRHIRYVHELDGEESATFGPVLARCAAALKEATGAELVYVYIFGRGIPHLHAHLAPHTAGDALNESILRGEFEEQALPSGAVAFVSKDFADVPVRQLARVADRVRELLS